MSIAEVPCHALEDTGRKVEEIEAEQGAWKSKVKCWVQVRACVHMYKESKHIVGTVTA